MLKLNKLFEVLSNLFLPKGDILKGQYNTFLEELDYSKYIPFLKQVDFTQNPVILDYIWTCVDYDKFGVANLLRRAKVVSEWAIAVEISEILIYQFSEQSKAQASDIENQTYQTQISLKSPDYITFMPPDPSRLKKRGYHIPQIIAKTIAQKLDKKLIQLVQKSKTTISQTELNRTARIESLNDALIPTQELQGFAELAKTQAIHIWLIDDFTTTGTSLYQVAKVINSVCPELKITAIAIGGKLES